MIISPHTDDGELGCGGTCARFLEEGKDVYWVVFSIAEDSVPEGFAKDELEREARNAADLLGIKPENLFIYRYKVRTFPSHRQEILDDLVSLNRSISPKIVFAPSLKDVHQDHHTIAQEVSRAFKKATILRYEEPWNLGNFEIQCLVHLKEKHIKRKLDILKCYRTQSFRDYSSPEFIRSLARVRGIQAGSKYAEAFEVSRWILK